MFDLSKWIDLISCQELSIPQNRPAQLSELPRSKFDPELFPHSAYVKIFVTFATKVSNFDVGNGERGRKWRENEEMKRKWREIDSLHFLILSLYFLPLSPFPNSLSISSLSLHFLHQNASHFVAKC